MILTTWNDAVGGSRLSARMSLRCADHSWLGKEADKYETRNQGPSKAEPLVNKTFYRCLEGREGILEWGEAIIKRFLYSLYISLCPIRVLRMVQLLFLIIFILYYFLLHYSELCHPLCLFPMLLGSSSQSFRFTCSFLFVVCDLSFHPLSYSATNIQYITFT